MHRTATALLKVIGTKQIWQIVTKTLPWTRRSFVKILSHSLKQFEKYKYENWPANAKIQTEYRPYMQLKSAMFLFLTQNAAGCHGSESHLN